MPNAKVLSEKQAIVAELTEKIQKATAGVIVDYKGITVEEDTALRKECREGGVDYAVVKNTLLRFAFNNTGLNDLDDLLNGTTSLALADDPVAPARVMADYAKKLDGKFEIKGGFMDGKPVDLATIQSLASIPALPVLQAQVLGTMLAPITGLAVVLKQIAEKNGAPAEAFRRSCRVFLELLTQIALPEAEAGVKVPSAIWLLSGNLRHPLKVPPSMFTAKFLYSLFIIKPLPAFAVKVAPFLTVILTL